MKSVLRYLAASVAFILSIAPVYWLITISLKREVDQFAFPPQWAGFTVTLEHYKEAFGERVLRRGTFSIPCCWREFQPPRRY